ncbi:MAG: TetR/AcrR family transcriptional regulator [Phycisphaerae bacterium]
MKISPRNSIGRLDRATPAPQPRATQARSLATEKKIVAAALSLLSSRSFEELTVPEIAVAADVSIGGFYARFTGKQAVLDWFHDQFVTRLLARADAAMSVAALAGQSARDVIRCYIDLAARAFERDRAILRQIALRSRTTGDANFRERIRAANQHLHDLLRARLRERRAEIMHPTWPRAIDIGLTFVSATLREYLLFQDQRPGFSPIARRTLVQELTEAFCAYLRIQS